jgi:gliding motility-associated-like protein
MLSNVDIKIFATFGRITLNNYYDMPIRVFCFSILLISHAFGLCGQFDGAALTNSAYDPGIVAPSDDMTEWKEQTSSRSQSSTIWKHKDGRIRAEYCLRPINYRDPNGVWQRISHKSEPVAGGWFASSQPHPVFLQQNGTVLLNALSDNEIIVGQRCVVNGDETDINVNPVEEHESTEFLSNEISSGVQKRFMLRENAIKYQYELAQAPVCSEAFYTIEESFDAPEGSVFLRDEMHGHTENNVWYGHLFVKNASGERISYIQGSICYDQSGSKCLAGYKYEMNANGKGVIKTLVDSSWLTSPDRIFPIVIDPLITGPLAAWGDELMNSCLIPEYNVDSLLISIPGQITVTAFYVNTSFYADPFTSAVKGDGAMFFSTDCDTTSLFEVQGPEANTAGLAYLYMFDFRNPMLCCISPSCSEQSFYFRMHLGRYTPEGDCNAMYIYYNNVTEWPFTAYIEGYTVETYGPQWNVSNTPICSTKCEFLGKARVHYGVPPYTFTHPWSNEPVIAEEPTPCDISNKIVDVPLNWPGCPIYCPDPFSLDVPGPTITDACGNVAEISVIENLNIKPAPSVEAFNPIICANSNELIQFSSCAPEYEIHWSGDTGSGIGDLPVNLPNNTSSMMTYDFQVVSNWNNCDSDTLNLLVHVLPPPDAEFFAAPDPVMQNIPALFFDESTVPIGDITSWNWSLDGAPAVSSGSTGEFILPITGIHTMCLQVLTEEGCSNEQCEEFNVISATISPTNIFTPNGDGLNDALHFINLEFFPESHLDVWNRWGKLVYSAENYKNNWNPKDLNEGTYYYVLTVKYFGTLDGYVQLTR